MKQAILKFVGYKRVGGLNFFRIGRIGFSVYVAKSQDQKTSKKAVKLVDRQLEISYN